MKIPRRMVIHPSCAKDWIIVSLRTLADGAIEVRAMPRPIEPLRFAVEDDTAAHLSRPSAQPGEQHYQHVCVFYVDP